MQRATLSSRLAILVLQLCGAMALGAGGVTGCDRRGTSSTGMPTTTPTATATVAIATLMTHPSLTQISEGVKQRLSDAGYVEGRNLKLLERNANGQIQATAAIASELSASDAQVIVAITTPMAQSVVKSATVPVVFAAVTDPVGSNIVKSLDVPEATVTGTCDRWPFDAQIALIREVLPKAKRLGILFNPGESASHYGLAQVRTLAPKHGFELVEAPVNSTADVYGAASMLAERVDAMYLSSDNTVISGMAGAVKVAIARQVPLFVGDPGTVEKGGLGTVSVSYRQLGLDTGDLVVAMLHGQRNLKVVVPANDELYLNTAAARQMGVTLSPDLVRRAAKVYDAIP